MIGVPKPEHNRRVPKRGKRNNFPKSVRKQAYERDNGRCQICNGKGEEIHHCQPRGRQGRGVLTNALTLCSNCHRRIHADNELMDYWIDVYTDRYGAFFWEDEHDRKNRKRDKTRPIAPRNKRT